jgi:hypothetical protein
MYLGFSPLNRHIDSTLNGWCHVLLNSTTVDKLPKIFGCLSQMLFVSDHSLCSVFEVVVHTVIHQLQKQLRLLSDFGT